MTIGGFLDEYEEARSRSIAERKRRKALADKAKQIQDDLDKALPIELQKQEAQRGRLAELRRLTALADAHQSTIKQDFSEKVINAAVRAVAQGNYSAMEALERELQASKDEEDFLIQATILLLLED